MTGLSGVSRVFAGANFHEAVLQLDRPVGPVLERLAEQDIIGGLDISEFYPELGNALLVCATETRSAADIARYRDTLSDVLKRAKAA